MQLIYFTSLGLNQIYITFKIRLKFFNENRIINENIIINSLTIEKKFSDNIQSTRSFFVADSNECLINMLKGKNEHDIFMGNLKSVYTPAGIYLLKSMLLI